MFHIEQNLYLSNRRKKMQTVTRIVFIAKLALALFLIDLNIEKNAKINIQIFENIN